jgi:hypothetical protein
LKLENEFRNEENLKTELLKAIDWLNREIYKKEVEKLKSLINSWDNKALKEYSELISKAKKSGIK